MLSRCLLLLGVMLSLAGLRQGLHGQSVDMLLEGPVRDAKEVVFIDSVIAASDAMGTRHPDTAIYGLHRAFLWSQSRNYHNGMAQSLLIIGKLYILQKGLSEQGLYYLRKAYDYIRLPATQRASYLVQWNNCMAAGFHIQGTYDSAMIYYYKAMRGGEAANWKDMEHMAPKVYKNMAILQNDMYQPEKALYYLKKAEKTAIRGNNIPELILTYTGYVSFYNMKNQFDSAAFYLDKIEPLRPENNPVLSAAVDAVHGIFYLLQDYPKKALPYLKSAIAGRRNNVREQINLLNTLGYTYAALNDYTGAGHYFERAYKMSLSAGIADRRLGIILNNLAEFNDSIGNYKKAYHYKALYATLQDSLKNTEKIKINNRLETQYRLSEKDKALALKELELARTQTNAGKKNIWALGLTSLLLIVILLLIMRARVRAQREQLERSRVRINGEENERARIGQQLHDDVMVAFSVVRMNLETLPEQYPQLKTIESFDDVVKQLNMASVRLRQTAHNLMPDMLLEEGLVSAAAYFCNSIARTTPLQVHFQHYGQVPRLDKVTEIAVYRIIQELVQNVIKHAGATEVLVQLNARKGQLTLTIEDDGKGMDPEALPASSGMGIRSIRTKLKAVNGTMEIHACVPRGTSVSIEIKI